jgi:hypothetical protein
VTQAIKRLKAMKQTAAAKKTVTLPKGVQFLAVDWKDIGDDFLDDLTKTLGEKFGINVQTYDDGDDIFMMTLSKTKLSKAQLKALFAQELGTDE